MEKVRIVAPHHQGRGLGVAARLLAVHLKGDAASESREVALFRKQPEGIVSSPGKFGIKGRIYGGISRVQQVTLAQVGLRFLAQRCGEIEAVVVACRARRLNGLEFIMPGG